jgi:hypothetical protein
MDFYESVTCLRTCHCHARAHTDLYIGASDIKEYTWHPSRTKDVGKGESHKTLGGHSDRFGTHFRPCRKLEGTLLVRSSTCGVNTQDQSHSGKRNFDIPPSLSKV